jgi:predicted HTH domain antitoxin
MCSLNLDIPYEITEEEARVLLAIGLFRDGRISAGKASEIAGYGRRAFMEILTHRGIAVTAPSSAELEEDAANA